MSPAELKSAQAALDVASKLTETLERAKSLWDNLPSREQLDELRTSAERLGASLENANRRWDAAGAAETISEAADALNTFDILAGRLQEEKRASSRAA